MPRFLRPRPHGAGPLTCAHPDRQAPALSRGRSGVRTVTAVGLAAAVALSGACGSADAPQAAPSSDTPRPSSTGTVTATATGGARPTTPGPTGTAGSHGIDKLTPEKAGAGGKITVGDVSLVARTKIATIPVYPSASGTSPSWTLKNPLPSGAPLVFLVLERRGDRLRVLVPVRPNESQGWIRASDVTLFQHDYRIVVSVGKHTLTVYKAGKVNLQVPVGLGTGSTPTPGGVFYTKELLRPPNPQGAYGPYAYGLSGYSTVLENFGGGDGEIGIHGTNEPGSVGKNVSHGCIRMTNANITKLAGMLPLGVPVQIVT